MKREARTAARLNHPAFSPGGKTLATGTGASDLTVRLWAVP
ncbi:hypothetical protein ACIRD8_06910 [Streptomyces sp. NPDC102451]